MWLGCERRGGGDTVTGELSGEGDRTGSGRRLPRVVSAAAPEEPQPVGGAPGRRGSGVGGSWRGAGRSGSGVPGLSGGRRGARRRRGRRGGAGRSLTDALHSWMA